MARKKEEEEVTPPPPVCRMRRFWLYRKGDPSGVSGTGYIAEGVEWTDGRVDIRFLSSHKTENRFSNLKEMRNLHGHVGETELVWIDPDPETGKEEA